MKAKPDLINKMYSKTPAEALATLAAEAVFRGDEGELRRIFKSLGERDTVAKIRATISTNALIMSLLLWKADVWRTYAQALEMHATALSGAVNGKELLMVELASRASYDYLASLLEAMRQICSDTGVDFQSILEVTDIDESIVREESSPQPEWVEMLVAQYRI